MIVVIDTNVVSVMFRSSHACRPILDAWTAGRFAWAITTEILLEYEEVLSRLGRPGRARSLLDAVDQVAEARGNLLRISPSFRFHLIADDADDDKFADCAIAAGADYILTNDHHFDVLIGSGHKAQPIAPEEFIQRHLAGV